MARVKIVRGEREVGFLDLPGWVLDTEAAPLPQFAGPDDGLALIVELRGSPVAGFVYRLTQGTLDIARPTRLTWERRAESLSPELAAIYLEGVVTSPRFEPPGEYFQFRWTTRRDREREDRERWRAALELNDEGMEASLRWDASRGPGFGEGYLRGYTRSETQEAPIESEFRADFYFEGPAFGRGYARSSGRGQEGGTEAYFELEYFGRRLPFGHRGYLRFGVAGRMQDEERGYSIPWLIQKVVAAMRGEEGDLPFTIWIGRVNYDASASDLYSDAAVRRVLAHSLLENRPISTRDALSVARWLQFQLAPQDVASTSWNDLLRSPSVAYRAAPPTTVNCSFTFDESVPSEKALELLVLLANGVRKRGGRLCFGSGLRE